MEYAQAKAAGRPGLAAEAGLLAAKALFNLDQLDRAEAWCSRALDDARNDPQGSLQPALWVVMAAVRGSLEQVGGAIDAVNRAPGLLNDRVIAGVRRTVYFDVAIMYRALGLWRHAVDASRAAIDADRHHGATGGAGLTMSQADFVETSLHAHDDLIDIVTEATARLLEDAAAVVGKLTARLAPLASPWSGPWPATRSEAWPGARVGATRAAASSKRHLPKPASFGWQRSARSGSSWRGRSIAAATAPVTRA